MPGTLVLSVKPQAATYMRETIMAITTVPMDLYARNTAHRNSHSSAVDLTVEQTHIARLTGDGRSSRDIAASRARHPAGQKVVTVTTDRVGGNAGREGPRHIDGRLAWLNNGRCQYDDALAAAEQGSEYPDDIGLATWSMAELIEAAVRSGRKDKAAVAFRQLSTATLESRSDWALGIRARCQALVSEGNEAELLYREAIERLGRTSVRVEVARAHLLYGEWLRRAGRRVDSRRELRLAYGTFGSMGVEGFAERARRELLATGETVRKRSVETFDELTPQEQAISRFASSGYTNSEIGTKLFLSERTVEWHLRKVFKKLGIRSRRQLRETLAAVDEVPLPA
jgi:DNA-binding NarL/FixJ family response regulator